MIFPHYHEFDNWTHTLPQLYWNVYSPEQRIKALCMEYEKLVCFTDSLVDTVNAQYAEIEEMKRQLPTIVADTLKNDPEIHADILAKVDEYLNDLLVGRDYKTIAEHGFIYNPNI